MIIVSIFSEKLIRTQAELLVQGGYLAAGYEYIIIDDCWLNHSRSAVRILKKKKEKKKMKLKYFRMVHYNQIKIDFQVELLLYRIMFDH